MRFHCKWRVERAGLTLRIPRQVIGQSKGLRELGSFLYQTLGSRFNVQTMANPPESIVAATPGSKVPLDKSGVRVREMFRQIAPRYDTLNHLLSLNIDKRWRASAVAALHLRNGSPILDVCTGTGDLALAMDRFFAGKVQVWGADFCYEMLHIARNKDSSHRIPFLEADAQSLPFPNDQFQCVTVAFGLRNVADTDHGLREMVRVCQPQGQVLVLEFSSPTWPGFKQLYGFYFRNVLPRVGQWMARNDKSAYEYLPQSVGQFPSGEALLQRMRAAGLVDTTVRPLTCGIASIYQGRKP